MPDEYDDDEKPPDYPACKGCAFRDADDGGVCDVAAFCVAYQGIEYDERESDAVEGSVSDPAPAISVISTGEETEELAPELAPVFQQQEIAAAAVPVTVGNLTGTALRLFD